MSVKGLIIALLVAIACCGVANAADTRSTGDVDGARIAEFNSIFGGVVMGYTAADHDVQVRDDMGGAAKGDMAEGEKCGMHEDGGCGCGCHQSCGCSKCGCHKSCGCNKCSSCGSKCNSCGCNKCNSCGNKCGCSKCGGGGCSTCHKDCGCGCPGAAYDCWGVWHGDSYNAEATRDSDYDPVLGDGGRGNHSFFGWGGW